jgi:hypothetical protein
MKKVIQRMRGRVLGVAVSGGMVNEKGRGCSASGGDETRRHGDKETRRRGRDKVTR